MKNKNSVSPVLESDLKFSDGRAQASLLKKLTFTYLYPLLEYGYSNELDVRYHFPRIEDDMESKARANELLGFWKKYSMETEDPKLLVAVCKLYGRRFFYSSIGSFLWVITRFGKKLF
jgi:hypothetical protein